MLEFDFIESCFGIIVHHFLLLCSRKTIKLIIITIIIIHFLGELFMQFFMMSLCEGMKFNMYTHTHRNH